jgi:hypothetical protein
MHRLQEKQEGPVQASANDPDICGLCNSNAIVFNSETNEAVYSQENAETLGAERGIYLGDDIKSNSKHVCQLR